MSSANLFIHLMKTCFPSLFSMILLLVIYGCAPKTYSVIDQEVGTDLSFIADDTVTRKEILEHLGQPSSQYEDGRIVIYWLWKSDQGTFVAVKRYLVGHPNSPESGYYNLVLIFTSHDVLEKHRIVFIR